MRTNIIWSIPCDEFRMACKEANVISDILKPLGLKNQGRNHHNVIKRAKEENIDISHITLGYGANTGKSFPNTRTPLKKYLVENSKCNRRHVKTKLINQNILKNECSICGLKESWNEKPIVMVLDHINGINDDYRLENLRLVCPNCNSQLDTFAGRNARKPEEDKKKHFCLSCNVEISADAKFCPTCYSFSRRKVSRPSNEELLKEISETSFSAVGRKYGVSDNAIRKWLK